MVNVRQSFLFTTLPLPEYDLHLIRQGKNLIPAILYHCMFDKILYLVVHLYMMAKSQNFNCVACLFVCAWGVHTSISVSAAGQVPATKQKCTPLNYNCSNLAESCHCFRKCDIYTPYMRTAGGGSCFHFSQKRFKFLTLCKKVFIYVTVLEWIK